MTRVMAVLVVVLAFGVGSTALAAFPGRNGLIAYTVMCCSGSDLSDFSTRLVAPDGSRATLIKDGSDRVVFSPDGRRLLWGDAFGFGLRVSRVDGRGDVRRLSRSDAHNAEWSPSGRRIAFVRYAVSDEAAVLRIRDRRSSRRLVAGDYPSWSVRGEIAFSNPAGGIDVIRPDGSELRPLVESGAQPDWSPDGRRLVYSASASVWTVRADGTGGGRRLKRGGSPSFSPDGHKIVYIGPGGAVRIMGAGGKHSHRLPFRGNRANDTTSFLNPDWQPLKPTRHGRGR